MKTGKFMILAAAAICMTACGTTTAPEETQKITTAIENESEEVTEVSSEASTEAALPRTLTEDELAEYSAYLSGYDCYGFLLSTYDDVRNVNLGEAFYGGAGASEQPDEEMIKTYLETVGQEELFTDLLYVPAEKINEILLEKTGYSLQEMQEVGNDLSMEYIDDYDAYFAEVGDTNYLAITCTSGTENADGTLTLECESGMEEDSDYAGTLQCTLTLDRETKRFISNTITGGIYLSLQ